ncbi:MAG: hypothetical protein AAFZ18_05130 [Myxococcota bacterium]
MTRTWSLALLISSSACTTAQAELFTATVDLFNGTPEEQAEREREGIRRRQTLLEERQRALDTAHSEERHIYALETRQAQLDAEVEQQLAWERSEGPRLPAHARVEILEVAIHGAVPATAGIAVELAGSWPVEDRIPDARLREEGDRHLTSQLARCVEPDCGLEANYTAPPTHLLQPVILAEDDTCFLRLELYALDGLMLVWSRSRKSRCHADDLRVGMRRLSEDARPVPLSAAPSGPGGLAPSPP